MSGRRQTSPSALSGWGRLCRHGSHPDKALGHRFFGQVSVRLDCSLCFRCLPSGQREQSSGTEGDKLSGRLRRHRTSKDLTAFRGGGRGLHPLLTLRPSGRCGGDGCSSGWTFSKKRAKRTASPTPHKNALFYGFSW